MQQKSFTNKQIAQILAEIATISELTGEEKFHILSYQKASRIVSQTGQSLEQVYREGGTKALIALEGIGTTMATHLQQLFDTGKMKYHQELLKKVPKIKLEMTRIPGVGAKTSNKLYIALKPKNIADLKKKLKTPKAKDNFGEKTIQNILDNIKIARQLSSRMLLSEAIQIATEPRDFLRSLKEVKNADFAGSMRRMREDVGDIDLVASSTNIQATIEAFAKAPFVQKIVRQGDSIISIIHVSGKEIDLEVSTPERYGNLLQHFTGSKDHAVELRTYAQSKNMSISEYGIKKGKKLLRFKNEKDVYGALDMQFIPPEMRENKGEIDAALQNKLPKLVELKDIKGNLHMHTSATDGKLSLEDMVKAAFNYGYKYIAITDHSQGLGFIGGLNEKQLLNHAKKIRVLDAKYAKKGMRVLAGIELNILADGSVDIEDRVLKDLDFVIASIHFSYRQQQEVVTKRLIKAIENPYIDCIGHPTGRKLGRREGVNANWSEVFKAAAKNNTILEINASPDRLDLNGDLIKLAKDLGCKFIINTDAHQPSHFDFMNYGVAQARRGWLTKADVINTKNFNDFLKSLKK